MDISELLRLDASLFVTSLIILLITGWLNGWKTSDPFVESISAVGLFFSFAIFILIGSYKVISLIF